MRQRRCSDWASRSAASAERYPGRGRAPPSAARPSLMPVRDDRYWSLPTRSGAVRVSIGEGIIEGSQNYHRAALSPDVAVGAFVECKAPSAPRKHRGRAKPEIWIGSEQEVDAADNCSLDALAADCLARMMQSD